jgi:vancomycin resistance protein YoaR
LLRRNRTKVRWLPIRLLADNLKSLFRGWYFHLTTRKVDAKQDLVSWTILSESIIQVMRWEGMDEINASRFHNMHTACTILDGVLLRPNRVFSLRRFFKEASIKQGFQTGPVIVNGQVTYADGGGVCAAASLIFDAALKANLAILEKHNHSTDMWDDTRFIHLGGDATWLSGRTDSWQTL